MPSSQDEYQKDEVRWNKLSKHPDPKKTWASNLRMKVDATGTWTTGLKAGSGVRTVYAV